MPIPINDKYVVPEHVVNFLCDGERSFLALRLVHGLLNALDTAVKGNMSLVPSLFAKEHSIRTSTLAAAVGPEKAKDNRWIRAACAELTAQNILSKPRIEGRVFWFKLSTKFSDAFSKNTRAFGIMYTEQVRQCRTLQATSLLRISQDRDS